MVARRQLFDGRLHLRPGATDPSAGISAGDDRRTFARRYDHAALHRYLSRECPPPGRDRGAWSPPEDDDRARQTADRRSDAALDRRATRPIGAPTTPLRLDRGGAEADAGSERSS